MSSEVVVRLPFIVPLLVSFVVPVTAEDHVSQPHDEILRNEHSLAAAIHAGDRARLEDLLAADYVLRGVPDMERSAWIDSVLAECWGERSEIEDLSAHQYGSVVVTTFRWIVHAESDDCRPPASRALVTDIWTRAGDKWQLQVRHSSVLAALAPAARTASPPRPWELKGELSFVATAGNASTRTVGLGSEFGHQVGRATTRANIAFLTSEAEGVTKARSLTAQARHGFRIGGRSELFGRIGYARDRFAGIQHRSVGEFGAAYQALVPDGHALTVEAGLGFTAEQRLLADDFRFASATGTLNYTWKISSSVGLAERLDLVSDLGTGRNWRATNAASITVDLTRRLSLKASHALEYRHLPVPGFRRTDMRTSGALVLGISGR